MSHLKTVQLIYEAFGRGDVPTILATLAEDVDWEYGAGENNVPWLQHRQGREGALAFFMSLQGMRIERFVPKTFLESGSLVVALVDIEFVVVATGKRVAEEDEVHLWHFDEQGKVCRFRHRADTLRQSLACGG